MAPLSRYTFDLQTDHTRPESYYDQICALSEQTINKNFEKLFEQRKDDITQLKYYKGDISDGKVMAVLNPPVITLKFDDVDAKMLFRLSFKSGYVIVGKGERNQINLSGWEIAVPANLSTMVVNPPEAENLSKQERKLANNSFHELQKTYEFHATATPEEQRPSNDKSPPRRMMKPGEYSIHRLFAAINVSNDNVWAPTSDSDWGLPDMQASSVPGPNGSRLSLQEWTEEAENRSRQASVMHVLRSWAADHRDSALFTLGLQIQLPEKEDSRTPSFIPTALRLQNYPYFTDAEIRDYKEPENFTVGEVGRLYNCFVYCEATDGRSLPKVKRLPFTGNLAEPNGPLGGDLGTGEINGSFVVSHHLYLESNLLKILRDLSRAIQVIPLTPECTVNDDKKDRFQPRFAFGSDPSEAWDKNRLPNSHVNRGDPLDAHFDWKPSPGGGYEWSDFVEAWGSKTEVYDFGAAGYQPGPFFRKWDINAKMSTKVSWVEGTSKILVSGRTEYFHWEGYNRSTPNFQASKNGSCQWGEFSTIVKWSFIINLRVPEDLQKDPTQYNGVIEPTLEGIDPKTFLPNDYNVDKSHMQYVLHNAHEPICNTINQQIAASISNINRAIKGKFASIGNFFYPGTQELIFGPPRLTKSGDIIATISYKE
ncbi:uncharacterized protein N7483_010728 [Penicillium malachiteum]|uniref:uncharacterized protein n=1 Tax=Penicillium malachiteum TaxID=1324776 RepID=UPI002549229D|nr:uncharacterized protein N7483_010728 [Penicillium malachiteum]KAJ5713547.1 hypothetical protein N7483_010728 [Penicillium malachiteum]